jgi:hypothetical protein
MKALPMPRKSSFWGYAKSAYEMKVQDAVSLYCHIYKVSLANTQLPSGKEICQLR